MTILAWLSLGFWGMASVGADSGEQISINSVDRASIGAVNTAAVYLYSTGHNAVAAPTGIKIPIFKDSDFPFITIIQDDGQGKGGGWQEAKADLEFIKVEFPIRTIRWRCRILIGMPLRTERMGKIPQNLAATLSSGITNMVTVGMDFDLPQGIFCETFHTGVKALFKATYPHLGSSVMKW